LRLGEDEDRLLEALGYLQKDREQDAASVLWELCPRSAARLAIRPARAVAAALGACRLWLTSPARLAPPCSLLIH
jgi:hypothetical protein